MGEEVLRQLKDDYGTKLVAHPIRTSSSFARAQQQEKSVFEISKARNVQSDYDFFIRTLLRLNPANQQLI
jgi:cellulose biosynthesis protein BcsQ